MAWSKDTTTVASEVINRWQAMSLELNLRVSEIGCRYVESLVERLVGARSPRCWAMRDVAGTGCAGTSRTNPSSTRQMGSPFFASSAWPHAGEA